MCVLSDYHGMLETRLELFRVWHITCCIAVVVETMNYENDNLRMRYMDGWICTVAKKTKVRQIVYSYR